MRRRRWAWLAAATVVAEAALRRYGWDAGLGTQAGILFLVGALLRTDPPLGRLRLPVPVAGAFALTATTLSLHHLLGASEGAGLAHPGPEGGIGGWWWAPWVGLGVLLLWDPGAWARLLRLARVEWLKLRRGRLLALSLLGTAVMALLAALGYDPLPGASGWSLASASFGAGRWAAEVFVLVLGAVAISGEAAGGTLKMMFPHAYRRSDWVLAKALVLVFASFLFLVVASGTGLAAAHLTEGLGDVTRELEPLFGEEEAAGTTVFRTAGVMASHFGETVLCSGAALVATAFLGVMLSCMFDSVVASLCLGFLLFAGLKFADVLLQLPRTALEGIYAWYPSQMEDVFGKLARGLNERWDPEMVSEGVALSVLAAAAALLIGIRALSRRDLQA